MNSQEALSHAIAACPWLEARKIMLGALEAHGRHAPLPPLMGVMEEATWWAKYASTAELKAYCLASFTALPSPERGKFLTHVQARGMM